jgi:uncharacterized protein
MKIQALAWLISSGLLIAALAALSSSFTSCMENRATAADIFLYAAREGNLVLLRQALAQGADLYGRTESGETALHLAALEGHEAIVVELLCRGLDPSVRYSGFTPLHCAAYRGHAGVIQRLLAHGPDVEGCGKPKAKALLRAFVKGSRNALSEIHALLKSHKDDALLHMLLRPSKVDVLREPSAGFTANNIGTPLGYAVSKGHAQAVEVLLAGGADSNRPIPEMGARGKTTTPLCAAATRGRRDILQALLRHGADHNQRDSLGNTPLRLAILHGHLEIVQELIFSGADVNAVLVDSEDTPLYTAFRTKKDAILKELLKYGASDLRRIAQRLKEHALLLSRDGALVKRIFQALDRNPIVIDALNGDLESLSEHLTQTNCYPCLEEALTYATGQGHSLCVKALLLAIASRFKYPNLTEAHTITKVILKRFFLLSRDSIGKIGPLIPYWKDSLVYEKIQQLIRVLRFTRTLDYQTTYLGLLPPDLRRSLVLFLIEATHNYLSQIPE